MAPKLLPRSLLRSKSSSSMRNTATGKPQAGEQPIATLKVAIVRAEGLIAKDRGGTSDPYCVMNVVAKRVQSKVQSKTVDPVWNETFEFQIYASLAERTAIEIVIWDKDMMGFKKEYMGEVYLSLEDWFPSDSSSVIWYEDEASRHVVSLALSSTRAGMPGQGVIYLQLGLTGAPADELKNIYEDLVQKSRHARPSLVSAPPTRGIGTVKEKAGRTDEVDIAEVDDGLSSESDEDEDDESDYSSASSSDAEDELNDENTPALQVSPASPISPGLETPTIASSLPTPTPPIPPSPTTPKQSKLAKLSGKLSRGSSPSIPSASDSAEEKTEKKRKIGFGIRSRPTVSTSSTSLSSSSAQLSPKTGRKHKKKKDKGGYTLSDGHDIVGICMIEICNAEDLPKMRNMTRTGWDMDPFVVISFGKKVFRTRVIRHSLDPTWDEKLLFHVRRYEKNFNICLSILDWDKMSSNDHVGDIELSIAELIESSPQPASDTGLYPSSLSDKDPEGKEEMKEFKLLLKEPKGNNGGRWEGKHNPCLTIKATYRPYAALRQKFWRQYLKEYDTDDTGTISHLELTSMLDSLDSTLRKETIVEFWERFQKKPLEDDLTIAEAIIALEDELQRPDSERRLASTSSSSSTDIESSVPPTPRTETHALEDDDDGTVEATPIISAIDSKGKEIALDQGGVSYSGPTTHPSWETEAAQMPIPPCAPSTDTGKTKSKKKFRKRGRRKQERSENSDQGNTDDLERVINVKNCPLCHRPRMSSKAELDIITHLAVCASRDWGTVDQIVVGNFVTASQAQRKWYTKVIGKVSAGDYKLGANSANIIVQNRMTGQLEEEKMQVYVRLGIRLLYKGMKSRMEGGRARKLLKSLSVKQGVKYDDPASTAEIPGFIEFHGLNTEEILDPLESFKNFNEFFYRKLKPTARPLEEPDNPLRIVSAADCRLMTFATVSEATKIWIKGREFSIPRLLGNTYKADWDRYTDGGALAIFRLAPQDYHRFHSPVEGKIGKMEYISGEYYTVNPQAIRSALDVYGENCRKIVPIDSPQFGRVMAVCVGAMMVGTIVTTVEEGQYVERGQEFGYFAFGGSTIVLLLEKGTVEWDEDLLKNGRDDSLETLVRVGMGIGKGLRK